jgi:hypothetical protein
MRDVRRSPLLRFAVSLLGSACTVLVLAGAGACGGSLVNPDGDADVDAAFEGGRRPPVPDGGDGGGVPPICPDAAPLPPIEECNVFQPSSCPPEEVCYPITYPPRGACDTERYGTVCIQGGTGGQGEPCGSGNGCKGGYVCVITGGGTQCAKMCQLGKTGQCATGFVCEPIDIPGYAACL